MPLALIWAAPGIASSLILTKFMFVGMFSAPLSSMPVENRSRNHREIAGKSNTVSRLLASREVYAVSRKACGLALGYRRIVIHAAVEVPCQSLEMFRELQVSIGLSIIVA